MHAVLRKWARRLINPPSSTTNYGDSELPDPPTIVTDFIVLKFRFRVHGIKNLRVADASVMPHVTTMHTQAPCYMIGEKAAEMMKETWN